MGKHTKVLEKAAPHVDLFDSPKTLVELHKHRQTDEDGFRKLAASLFGGMNTRSVVAFASVHSGAGASHIVRGLSTSLTRMGKSVGVFDKQLKNIDSKNHLFDDLQGAGLSILGTPYPNQPPADGETVDLLRTQFDCILIDCGSVEATPGVAQFASFCDGVVLVVEADRSNKRQFRRAQQVVQLSHGKLLGAVLNKRRYPIPAWLYKIL